MCVIVDRGRKPVKLTQIERERERIRGRKEGGGGRIEKERNAISV